METKYTDQSGASIATVVVTGGIRGIGRAIVERYCQAGSTVHVSDVVSADSKEVACLPQGAQYHQVDSSDQQAVHTWIHSLTAGGTHLDVLINNAGITRDALAVRCQPEQWRQVIDVNLSGAFWCAQAALRQMVAQRSGVIINLSSVVASTGNPGQVNYAASKAGIDAMTKTLAREYGARGIRVNAVAPGFIATPMTDTLSDAVKKNAIEHVSLRRAGQPYEVADLVFFLTSPAAAYITGQIIHINGGMW